MQTNIYYSPSALGFFDVLISGDALPKDAIPVAPEDHRRLMDAQASGHIIAPGADGYPAAVEPPPPSLGEERTRQLQRLRDLREPILNRITGIALAAQAGGDAETISGALAARQALLDITRWPAILEATTVPAMKSAAMTRYAQIVAAAPEGVRKAFSEYAE